MEAESLDLAFNHRHKEPANWRAPPSPATRLSRKVAKATMSRFGRSRESSCGGCRSTPLAAHCGVVRIVPPDLRSAIGAPQPILSAADSVVQLFVGAWSSSDPGGLRWI
jgi:hypothetical protein